MARPPKKPIDKPVDATKIPVRRPRLQTKEEIAASLKIKPTLKIFSDRHMAEMKKARTKRGRTHDRGTGGERTDRPFLVLRKDLSDQGARPLMAAQDVAIGTLTIVDTTRPNVPLQADDFLREGRQYRISGTVWNLGTVPAMYGLAELTITGFGMVQKWLSAGGTGKPDKPFDAASFSVWPGEAKSFTFNKLFTPKKELLRAVFILHAGDITRDPVTLPYRPEEDRHVTARILSIKAS